MELVKAEKLAKELMTLHGLTAPIWSFRFDNAKKRFGRCVSNRLCGEVYRGEITLSKGLVMINDEAKVRDTILHEIAHGLTPGHGHDYVWKRKCVEIGAKPERCYSSDEVNTLKETAKYQATCGGCGRVHAKYRIKPQYMVGAYSCGCQRNVLRSKKILLTFVDTKAV